MKLLILTLHLFLFSPTATYCDGYADGYKEGYCYGKENTCIPPPHPPCPVVGANEENTYKFGYRKGFTHGRRDSR